MRETIGQAPAFHNKQIAPARVIPGGLFLPMSSRILQRTAPIGEARDREILKDASTYVYEERPEGPVQAHMFLPENPGNALRPVIVFFHGGFWDVPTPTQFVPHCLHFRSRGAVAVAAETRTTSRHSTSPVQAIQDARDLIRWLRHNADLFQIDVGKIIVCGAAGGAFLALQTALPKPTKDPHPLHAIEFHPHALVLFSALVDTPGKGPAADRFSDGKTARQLSPLRLVRRKLPPMLFLHGTHDRTTPFSDVAKFRGKSRWRGNKCEVIDFPKAEHSFFNFNVNHAMFELTVNAADRFLTDLGLLPPPADEDAPGGNPG